MLSVSDMFADNDNNLILVFAIRQQWICTNCLDTFISLAFKSAPETYIAIQTIYRYILKHPMKCLETKNINFIFAVNF